MVDEEAFCMACGWRERPAVVLDLPEGQRHEPPAYRRGDPPSQTTKAKAQRAYRERKATP
jgi:hypothetical protein